MGNSLSPLNIIKVNKLAEVSTEIVYENLNTGDNIDAGEEAKSNYEICYMKMAKPMSLKLIHH